MHCVQKETIKKRKEDRMGLRLKRNGKRRAKRKKI